MRTLPLVCLSIAIVASFAVQLGFISGTRTTAAHPMGTIATGQVAVDPAAIMRAAPHDLPTENWNAI